jgi:hypothetical protein
VWKQNDGIRYNIWANRYVVGTGWGTATLIETDNSGNAYNPTVAMDGSGNAIAVWDQRDGTYFNIWANRYVVGTGWNTATLIETDDTGNAQNPEVAMDSSGNAIAVWIQDDGTRDSIFANRYVVGTGWSTATLIENDDGGDAYSPKVALDGSGNAIAVWYQNNGTSYNILANRYVVGTGWSTATLIETDDAGDAQNPEVAVDGSGNAIAVWDQDNGTHLNIWANRYVVGTGWSTPTLIETDNVGDAQNPEVAMDGSGNVIAVWDQDDGPRINIWANRFVVGTGWSTPTLIETHNAGDALHPEVAVDGSGNAIAVWSQSDSQRDNIWANRYIIPDITAPVISLTNPIGGTTTDVPTITVSGATEPGVHLTVNGIVVEVESDGSYEFLLALFEGENLILAEATDASDNSDSKSVTVTYVNPTPDLEQELQETIEELNATKENLTEAKNTLETTQKELDKTKENLTKTKEALDTTQTELDETKTSLENTQAELDNTEIALETTNDELESSQAELEDVKKDLDAIATQMLLIPLGILVILVIIMFVLNMNLSKKIGKKGQSPSEFPEKTIRPGSAEELEGGGVEEEDNLPSED